MAWQRFSWSKRVVSRGWYRVFVLALVVLAAQCARFKPNGAPLDQVTDGDSLDAGDAAPLAESESGSATGCTDHCAEEGSLRCAAMNVVEACSKIGPCLSWLAVGGCPTGEICCGGACEVVDESNCFGCGTRCKDETPVCGKGLNRCVCDDAVCAKQSKVCDSTLGKCAEPPKGLDYYVEAGVESDAGVADGTVAHPFRTITVALSRARSATQAVRIHVGPGTFDADHGELFPLVIRGSTSLLANDVVATTTIIAGSGYYDPRKVGGGAQSSIINGTIVIGDTSQLSSLSGFTLKPGAPGITQAVFCDRGNASDGGPTPADPNTILSHLIFAPGYDTAIIASTTTLPAAAGCNLRVTGSTFQARHLAISASGCDDNADAPGVPVALDLGDGTESGGNTFLGQGVGVMVGECVSHVALRYNTFLALDGGVDVKQLLKVGPYKHAVFENNSFTRLTQFGVRLTGGAVVVDTFSDNQFSGISSTGPDPGSVSTALLIEGAAQIKSARRNVFRNNDIGVRFDDSVLSGNDLPYDSPPTVSDFGTSDDPGSNYFQCNSQPLAANRSVPGGDLVIETNSFQLLVLPFVGNTWDHSDPILQRLISANVNGSDVMLRSLGSIVVNTAPSNPATATCPPERVP